MKVEPFTHLHTAALFKYSIKGSVSWLVGGSVSTQRSKKFWPCHARSILYRLCNTVQGAGTVYVYTQSGIEQEYWHELHRCRHFQVMISNDIFQTVYSMGIMVNGS